jgi:hypothetical protein
MNVEAYCNSLTTFSERNTVLWSNLRSDLIECECSNITDTDFIRYHFESCLSGETGSNRKFIFCISALIDKLIGRITETLNVRITKHKTTCYACTQ